MNDSVAVTVAPNREADRVVYTFGDQSYGLRVEEAMLLANHTLAAINALRPLVVASVLPPQEPDIIQ